MLTDDVVEYRESIFNAVRFQNGDHLRILNLGCGEGYDNSVFLGKDNVVVGLDISVSSERWEGLRSKRSYFILNPATTH